MIKIVQILYCVYVKLTNKQFVVFAVVLSRYLHSTHLALRTVIACLFASYNGKSYITSIKINIIINSFPLNERHKGRLKVEESKKCIKIYKIDNKYES